MHAGSEEAFEKTEGKPLVERPKALGDIRGVSYILRDFPAIRADRGSCAGVQINTRLFHIKNYRRNHGFL